MSENSEFTSENAPAARSVTPVPELPPNRLYKVAAWVGIVAGTVFVIAVIFFSGFFLGRHSGGNFGHHWGPGPAMMDRDSDDRGPGHGPGMWGTWGPGGPGGPGQPPTTPNR